MALGQPPGFLVKIKNGQKKTTQQNENLPTKLLCAIVESFLACRDYSSVAVIITIHSFRNQF